VLFSLIRQNINPHPTLLLQGAGFVPSPIFGGGEEAEKQGITSAYSLDSPRFSVKTVLKFCLSITKLVIYSF
jgi:hypothetical protein